MDESPRLNVRVSEAQVDAIERKVADGSFRNQSEAIRHALRVAFPPRRAFDSEPEWASVGGDA